MYKLFKVIAFLCLLVYLPFGCSNGVKMRISRPATGSAFAIQQSGLSQEEKQFRDKNCFMGCPVLAPNSGYGPTAMVYREGYVLQHSSIDKIPLWVAEKVTSQQVSGPLNRPDIKFKSDKKLTKGERAEDKDYTNSGYNRGHQAPSANQTVNQTLQHETFILSNACPQVPNMNQQIWKDLEDLTRKWVVDNGEAYEITGPIFYEEEEDNPSTADGIVEYWAIGDSQVAVPTHFYKIVIVKDQNDQLQAIAFVISNEEHSKPDGSDVFVYDGFIKSIDWIERHTGLDFMPSMGLQEQNQLENNPSSMWN